MKSVLLNGVSAVCILLLAGCGPLSQLVASGTPSGPVDLDGDGVVTAAEKVLQSYSPTYAGAAGGPATVEAAMARAGGIEGFGVGTAGVTSAADTTGTYKTANLVVAGNQLTVTVDGKSYTMTATDSDVTTLNGKLFKLQNYGISGASLTAGGNIAPINAAQKITLDDTVSLTFFVKNYARAVANGVENYTYDGYSVIATGLETPVNGIPTSIVSYKGAYFLIAGLGGTSASSQSTYGTYGTFELTANFNTKKADFVASGGVATSTGANIIGNKFTGTVTGQMTGTIAGGFYGATAQDVAGVGEGNFDNGSGAKHAEMGFIGSQVP